MAYKSAFFLKVIGLFLGDAIIPIVSALIYQVSAGIPGWNIYEFILFQGTLIIVIGLWHTLFASLLGETITSVKEGTFDKVLLKPFPSLAYLTAMKFDLEGIGEVLAGIIIVGFAFVKLDLSFSIIPLYLLFILLGALFEYSLTIFAASFAFIFVKTWRLYEFISALEKFGRYPLGIYNEALRLILTFFIPVAIASYYPASVILGKETLVASLSATIPVVIFFLLSLLCWKYAMKKYGSAGG
jgi:ABC-2 type transport system permease protein